MHMFSDLHTFLFAFLLIHRTQLITCCISISCTSGRGCDRQFSIYIVCSSTPDSVFTCPLQTCITLSEEFTKTNPQKSWVVDACHWVGGIRELLSVVNCNSLALSCGSVMILVAAYRALLWLLVLLLATPPSYSLFINPSLLIINPSVFLSVF